MQRPLIAVFRGGYSGESIVSHQSATRMMEALDADRYDAVYITIDRVQWTCEDRRGSALDLDRGQLTVDRGQGGERVAAALIAIHGSPGEDGLLQGHLDILGIPYQTGDVLNMAVTFSKFSTVALLRQLGFPVAPSVLVMRSMPDALARAATIGFPCFVKPDRSGSSLGVSKVKHVDELGPALQAAFEQGRLSADLPTGEVAMAEVEGIQIAALATRATDAGPQLFASVVNHGLIDR